MIPKIIHLICLAPYTDEEASDNVVRLSTTNPDYKVMVHTEPPKNFIFEGMPVSGPSGLCNLTRMDCLRRWGGWYFDLDVQVRCDLSKMEKALSLGNNLAVSKMGGEKVCTFVSCCPENWHGWDIVIPYLKAHPSNKRGHYCTNVMGKLLREQPNLCDYLPKEFVYSKNWLNHKK